MEEIERLPQDEQHAVFVLLARKVASVPSAAEQPWLGKKLSFEDACDVVFRENRELLSLLAK
jgi:hypothetical protein